MSSNSNEKLEKALDDLAYTWENWDEVWSEYHDKAEKFWNSLTEEQREQAFYSVVSRIHRAEIENNSSYRTVLYDHFGFGPSSYVIGMESGYMDIHNILFDGQAMSELEKATQLIIRYEEEDVYVSEPGIYVSYEYNPYRDYDRKVAVINVMKGLHETQPLI